MAESGNGVIAFTDAYLEWLRLDCDRLEQENAILRAAIAAKHAYLLSRTTSTIGPVGPQPHGDVPVRQDDVPPDAPHHSVHTAPGQDHPTHHGQPGSVEQGERVDHDPCYCVRCCRSHDQRTLYAYGLSDVFIMRGADGRDHDLAAQHVQSDGPAGGDGSRAGTPRGGEGGC